MPIVLEFLAGKIGTPEQAAQLYLETLKELQDTLKLNRLSNGIQQFRLTIRLSRMSAIVDEDSAARLWTRALRTQDSKLPEALKEPESMLAKRKRD